jgi:branched-chain amino acid transport system permease protein
MVMSPSQTQLAGLVLIYAMVAVSLVVLTGWSGNISLGQFAFVGFGAAATGTLIQRHGWDLFAALPVACLVAAAVALVVGVPALRVRGPFLAVTTLAFAVTSSTFFLAYRFFPWFVTENVERPFLWGRFDLSSDRQMYYVCLIAFAIVIAAAHGVRRSRTGRALVASRDNPIATQSFGISTTRLHLTAFAMSGAMAGLAGGIYVLHQHGLHTDSFGPDVSLRLFSMVVIGGLGSLPGAVLGAVYIRGAEFFLSHGWSELASGFGIVALLIASPGGLGELIYRMRDDLLRRVADRRGLIVPSLVADMREREQEPERDREKAPV